MHVLKSTSYFWARAKINIGLVLECILDTVGLNLL